MITIAPTVKPFTKKVINFENDIIAEFYRSKFDYNIKYVLESQIALLTLI